MTGHSWSTKLSQSVDGIWFLDGVLDPIRGANVAGELKHLEQRLFEADWAEARARVGDGVSVSDLARTPAQRRADALVEMATRSAAAPAGGTRPEPLFTVLVGYETASASTPSAMLPPPTARWITSLAWAAGGLTTTDNGRPACAFHKRARERPP